MSESMADFEKEIDESLKTLNVVENNLKGMNFIWNL